GLKIIHREVTSQLQRDIAAGILTGPLFGPGNSLLQRRHLQNTVAGKQLFSILERPLDYPGLAAAKLHPTTLTARAYSVSTHEHPSPHHLLIVIRHGLQDFLTG